MSYNTKENWRDMNEFETIIKKIYFINITIDFNNAIF